MLRMNFTAGVQRGYRAMRWCAKDTYSYAEMLYSRLYIRNFKSIFVEFGGEVSTQTIAHYHQPLNSILSQCRTPVSQDSPNSRFSSPHNFTYRKIHKLLEPSIQQFIKTSLISSQLRFVSRKFLLFSSSSTFEFIAGESTHFCSHNADADVSLQTPSIPFTIINKRT